MIKNKNITILYGELKLAKKPQNLIQANPNMPNCY